MGGGEDFEYHLSKSGEPSIPQLVTDTGGTTKPATQVAALNVKKRAYQKLYMDYWNSTAELTGTGRPVDGVICPMAPHAGVIPCQYRYVGHTVFLNAMDYTRVAIPVTYADKRVDVLEKRVEPLKPIERSSFNVRHLLYKTEPTRILLPTKFDLLARVCRHHPRQIYWEVVALKRAITLKLSPTTNLWRTILRSG